MPQNQVDVKKNIREIWPLQSEVEELRGKVNLKGRDRQALYESSQLERKKNDDLIAFLRQDIKAKRIALAEGVNTAIEAVDQKMCETANQLNELRHQRVQRELKVQELQAELDRMADILAKEECDSEEMRHTRLLENSLDKALMKCQTARNISSQYEAIVEKLKEDVVIRVEMQDEKRQQLEQKRQQLEGKRNQLLREKERMLQIYHDLRYTGEKALSDGERKLEEKQDQLRKLWDQHWRTEKKVLHGKKLYQTLSVATDNLLKKLHGITLKPPHNRPRTGNLKHDLELCKAKLSALLESVDVKQIEDAEENISAPEYHEFLESRLPSTNVRIHLAESLGSLTDFHYDSHTDDTDVLTRDDIKRQGQELADAKLKPKKKKPRKK
ncbi:coiled-coil domain-containing protein 151-like [Lingula anatina]|uniref:Coiled-coil domain-containing protein 151-like n=1 Tax=Lingula anatina TaxID=7574 RepID=A0A1S3I2G2_LINAN|nr:coiled-coil domain-containing protein 151-like [Lingula anatina]|eukprot:XP_013392455.1 coiled-coil domain-containing protein 151-like [Lingula anatina]